jgi:hypothetical protein
MLILDWMDMDIWLEIGNLHFEISSFIDFSFQWKQPFKWFCDFKLLEIFY